MKAYLATFTPKEIRRTLHMLAGFQPTIALPHISMTGGGTEQAVEFGDIQTMTILLGLATLAPGALRLKTPNTFSVPNPLLLWHVRDMIKRALPTKEDKKSGWRVGGIHADRKERTLKDIQVEGIKIMTQRHHEGNRGNALFITAGVGKSLLLLEYMYQNRATLAKHVIWSYPKGAESSIADEILAFFPNVYLLWTNKGKPKPDAIPKGVKLLHSYKCEGLRLPAHAVIMIEHDSLRSCVELEQYMPESIFIMDEFHKALSVKTLRTEAALRLALVAQDFLILSGTPTIDNNIFRIIPWLTQLNDVEVNAKNFFVAMNAAVSHHTPGPMKIEEKTIIVPMTSAEYRKLAPVSLGGINPDFSSQDVSKLMDLALDLITPVMVKEVERLVENKQGVMIVARDKKHVQELKKQLERKANVFVLETGKSLNLTPDAVKTGKVPDYQVVIVPKNMSMGYNLTRLSAFVTSVYPSNSGDREQLTKRVNRTGNTHPILESRLIHGGILSHIHERQELDTGFGVIVKDLASAKVKSLKRKRSE